MMKHTGVVIVGVVALALSGCEGMGTAAQSKTVQGATMGGLLGGVAGAVMGNQSGRAGEGAAIGAGLGALGGGLMGKALQDQAKTVQLQQTPLATSQTKFCPVGGELYTQDIKYCPTHGVELRFKEE